jgi:predicted nucleic acid-binding protein
MSVYLLDTNHLSPIVTINHELRRKILARFEAGDRFAITATILFEFLVGIRSLPRATQNMHIWDEIKADFIYYPVERQNAERAVDLKFELRRKGRQLEMVDALSVVVALRYDLILLTKDKDFLAIPGLNQKNWL